MDRHAREAGNGWLGPAGILRLCLLAGAGAMVAASPGSPGAAVALWIALGLVAAAPWITARFPGGRGRVTWGVSAADAVVVGLCLLRGAPDRPELLGAYFVALLVAVLAGGSPGWMIGGLAAPGLYLALRSAALAIDPATVWAHVGLLTLASYHFLSVTRSFDRAVSAFRRAEAERDELWTLLEITDAVTSTLDLREVMQSIVQRVGRLVGAESCSILLSNDDLSNCFVLAASESPDVDMLEIDLAKYPELRRAIETREPVRVDDVENDPLVASVREVLVQKGYRSMLVLPLLFGREVLGTLFLRASRDRPFDQREMRFCKVAAGASANALKNAMLYREVLQEAERHRATGEKLRQVLDCSPDMIVATDPHGWVMEMNGPALALDGAGDHDEDSAPSIDGLLHTDGLAAEAAADPERVLRREVTIPGTSDAAREINLVSAPLRGADGTAAGRVWVGRDVTEIRRAERSLAQVERLTTLGEIVAGVAHELNNPLSAVLGYSEMMRRRAEDGADVDDIERIVHAGRRCKRIVENLLGFARKRQPERKHADLNQHLRRVVELRAYNQKTFGIRTVLDLDNEMPPTLFDPYQIEQVVMNLITNAEQAIRSDSVRRGGTIVVRTYHSDSDLHVEVEDDGPGIAPGAFPRIFDPFYTTKDVGQGTGLGLSVSFGILQEHGGALEARPPVPGRGACFVLRLPLVDVPREGAVAADDAVETPAALESLRGRRVLIAEDEPLVREFLERLLGQEGFEVTAAQDGEEAWEKLADAEFDLVIADLRMPRMDGQELYERVAEERPELLRRFVFSSGDLARDETVSFLRGLPNRLLAKPLQVETVRHVIRRALEQAG
jgi:two-component system NtrC family sensor kinase